MMTVSGELKGSAQESFLASANGVDRRLRGEVSVEQLRFNLKLGNEHFNKLPTYYLYRSEEHEGNRPIIDGVYIQRGTLGPNPPKDITILLEWQ